MRRDEITYVIEDLDAAEPGTSSDGAELYDEARASGSRDRPDMRRNYSADLGGRYGGRLLSPDDALRDLRRHAHTGTEFRWELHASKTDVDLARRCGCHDAASPAKRAPERGDLRKHHSAETDQWSLRPESQRELRKHSSDDSRMAAGTSLQVPEVLPNPRPRCTCRPRPQPPQHRASSASSISSAEKPNEEASPAALKKHASEDSKLEPPKSSKKSLRARWAAKAHLSLPAERKTSTKSQAKSKSLKERQKYSVRRSISPEPDPRQIMRRLLSPEVLENAKWAPYEGCSPLPNMGARRREKRHIREIKWQPSEESPEGEDSRDPFENVTPTHHPPPEASPHRSEDEEERWRFLNQVSPIPIFWKDDSSPQLWSPRNAPDAGSRPKTPPPRKRSIIRAAKKKTLRAKSEGRARPQLTRSKALLEVHLEATKRSMSEEAPQRRASRRLSRGLPHRAKSEDVSKYDGLWNAGELLQYVTTV